jgi:hypothetical protein
MKFYPYYYPSVMILKILASVTKVAAIRQKKCPGIGFQEKKTYFSQN